MAVLQIKHVLPSVLRIIWTDMVLTALEKTQVLSLVKNLEAFTMAGQRVVTPQPPQAIGRKLQSVVHKQAVNMKQTQVCAFLNLKKVLKN